MKIPYLITAPLLALTSPLVGQTLVLDTFNDDSRAGPNSAPTSLQWFSTSSSSSLTVADGGMTLATGSSGRGFIGYFTDAGSPVTINVGEVMSLSFDFTVGTLGTGNNDAFRIALANSFESRIDSDSLGNRGVAAGESPYNPSRGYLAVFDAYANPTATPHVKLLERKGEVSGHTEFVSAIGSWDELERGNSPNPFTSGESYSALLSVSRISESQFEIFTSLTGPDMEDVSLTAVDESPLTMAFDTIYIHTGSNAWEDAVYDNIRVEVTPIPEPSTYALIAGGTLLGVVLLRRRMTA